MTDETKLKDAFAAIESPPSRLTSTDALRLGKRRRRNRRYVRTGIASASLTAMVIGGVAWGGVLSGRGPAHTASQTPAAASGPTCTATLLPSGPGISTYEDGVRDIDPTGHYMVANGSSALVYHDGEPTVIPLPKGINAGNMQATAVNANGTVIGVATSDGGTHGWAWQWHAGTLTRLPTPDLPDALLATPTGINARGDIVGTVNSQASGPASLANDVAVEWPSEMPGTVKILSRPAGQISSNAYAISDSGYVVGDVDFAVGRPSYWDPSGQGHLLAQAPGHPYGRAVDVVGSIAYGYIDGSTGALLSAAEWDLTTGRLTLKPAYSSATQANAQGDAIMTGGAGLANQIDVVLSDGRRALLPLPSGMTGTAVPVAIADNRTVAGWIDPTGRNAPLQFAIWHC